MARTHSRSDAGLRSHRGNLLRLTLAGLLAAAPIGASAHDISPLTDEAVAGAVYNAKALSRTIPECAALFSRSQKRQRACDEAQEAYREGFRVRVEECTEGGSIPDLNVPVPSSHTCTVTMKETPDSPVVGRVAVLYFAAGKWNALLFGEPVIQLD